MARIAAECGLGGPVTLLGVFFAPRGIQTPLAANATGGEYYYAENASELYMLTAASRNGGHQGLVARLPRVRSSGVSWRRTPLAYM